MGIDGANALAAKVLTDAELAKQINEAKTEADFNAVVAKLGYVCTVEEFQVAFAEIKAKQPLDDEQLDQASGGLSIVGVDYCFTATQTARA